MSSINKFYPINVKGDNIVVGTYGNVCLLANGQSQLTGNTYTNALGVGCDVSAGLILTLSGDTFLKGRTDVSGSLYVNGVDITSGGGGGGTQDLSSVLFYGTNANNQVIQDLSGIVSATLDLSANTTFNQSYMAGRLENVSTILNATFNITFPMKHFYNFYDAGSTAVYLPSIASLRGPQQTQLCFTKTTNAVLNIFPDPADTLRLPDGSVVANYYWATVTSMLIIQCSVLAGGTWRIGYVENEPDTLGDVMLRGAVASVPLDMDGHTINNVSELAVYDVNSTGLINSYQLYTENFYYSNISSDIPITNWQAQTPDYSPTNGVYTQFSGSGTYTGTSGVITSGTTAYTFSIVRGLYQPAYYLTYFPPGVTSQQAFTMDIIAGNTFTFKTINYTLQAGQYVWGLWYQNQQNTSATVNTFIKTSAGVVLANENGVFPGNDYPNWIFKSLTFSLTGTTDIYFEATSVSKTFQNRIVMTGMELTQTGAMVVTDTITNKTATISGTQSFLNSLYVNGGLQVDSGGIDVIGGIVTSTAYGSSNISVNSPYGSTTKANNSGDIISIGAAVNQDLSSNVLGNYRVVAVGNGANTGTVFLQDAVSMGYNASCTSNAIFSVAIGSSASARGAYTVAIAPNALANPNGGVIGASNVVVGFGACGTSVYNGFGVLSSTQNVFVGTRAGYSAADNRNTGIGYQALWVMNGRNGVTANGNSGKITQNNTALGYNAGSLRNGYNTCTFLGADTDASVENLENATAIGYNARVDVSNCIVLGSTGTKTKVMGDLFGVTTINGAVYPPTASAGTLAAVLTNGNVANLNIDMSTNNIQNAGYVQTNILKQTSGPVIYVHCPFDMCNNNLANVSQIAMSDVRQLNMNSGIIMDVSMITMAGTKQINMNTGAIINVDQVTMAGTKLIDMNGGTITEALSVSTELIQQAQTNTASPDISLQNTNATASAGVRMRTTRLRPAGAGLTANDTLFVNETYGTNASNASVQYAGDEIDAQVTTAGAHQGIRYFSSAINGTMADVMWMGANIRAFRPIILNSGCGIQNAYKALSLSANALLASVWGEYCGNHVFVSQTTPGWIIGIGAPSNFAGAVCAIENTSAFDLTISTSTGTFAGPFGNTLSTYTVYPGQIMRFVSNGTNWWVNRIDGVPMTVRYVNPNQATLSTAATTMGFPTLQTTSISTTTGIRTWGARDLGYSAGVFTNNSGFPMTLLVQFTGIAASTANHRFIGVNYLNTTRNPYARPMWVNFAAGGTATMSINQTVHLGTGDTFSLLSQCFGAATTINAFSNVTMTRIN